MEQTSAKVLGPREGKAGFLGSIGGRIISPAGFEQYFAEMVELGGSWSAAPQALRSLGERYGLEVKPQSIPELLERFGLRLAHPK